MTENKPNSSEYVFVYGTLKNMPIGEFIAEGVTVSDFLLFNGGFPVCVASPYNAEGVDPLKKGQVRGQVFRVTEKKDIEYLDRYEGQPSFFNRELRAVETPDGVKWAWMYISTGAAASIPRREQIAPNANGQLIWSS